jgi:DNA-binding IclR family transcriptional regulator
VKNRPSYAITSVDHALLLATILQVEGALTVSEAAQRLGVARSTAHRLLSTLCYRDFAVQNEDRRYSAGPVLSLAARSNSRAALLRAVAMPHLAVLTGRVGESTNLLVLAGDQVRFIGSVEGTQALRVGNREGMVFPAHRTSGGVLLLADLPAAQFDHFPRPGTRGRCSPSWSPRSPSRRPTSSASWPPPSSRERVCCRIVSGAPRRRGSGRGAGRHG